MFVACSDCIVVFEMIVVNVILLLCHFFRITFWIHFLNHF